MAKNTSVALDKHFETFISERVAAGRYGSASEMVRAGLRMLEMEENKLIALRRELTKGEESGECDQSHEEIIAQAQAELKAEGHDL